MFRLPQLILYSLLNALKIIPEKWKLKTFDWSVIHVVGGVVIVIGTFGYAIGKLYLQLKKKKESEIEN